MVYAAEDAMSLQDKRRGSRERQPRRGLSNFLNEVATSLAMRKGEVLVTAFPRVYQDQQSIYGGPKLVVDRKDGRL